MQRKIFPLWGRVKLQKVDQSNFFYINFSPFFMHVILIIKILLPIFGSWNIYLSYFFSRFYASKGHIWYMFILLKVTFLSRFGFGGFESQ